MDTRAHAGGVAMISRDEWLKALSAAGFNDAEDDQDAVSIGEFAILLGIGRSAAADRLEAMVAKGAAVKTKKWQRQANGRRAHVNAFRLAEKTPTRKRARA
jgi:hypothetical protein